MIRMKVITPVDRDVEVTVSLTLKESELRRHERAADLAYWLAQQLAHEFVSNDGSNPYLAVRNL